MWKRKKEIDVEKKKIELYISIKNKENDLDDEYIFVAVNETIISDS